MSVERGERGPRCPSCGGLCEEMEYDCDFSFSEVKRYMCRRCGTSFEADPERQLSDDLPTRQTSNLTEV